MNKHEPVVSGRHASVLEARRLCKIASSPYAYVRGTTERFYDLIGRMPPDRIPEGPPVWICGDCHLGNLGAVANEDGRIDIQIRDLDQTVIANPAFDLVRLALSLVTAARGATLPGIVVARMMDAMANGYADGVEVPAASAENGQVSEIVATTRRRALGRRWRHLSQERLKGKDEHLPRGKRFFDLETPERDGIDALVRDPGLRTLVLALDGDARVTARDAAYWIKGCSSLGRLRYAVLLEAASGGRPFQALIYVKEAVPHLAPAAPGLRMPGDHAERVVAGARALSPNLGERMIAGQVDGTSVTVRELFPQDLKIDVDQFSGVEAVRIAANLAGIVGRAHGRQMDKAQRNDWIGRLRAGAAQGDAPGWLWSVVTDLMTDQQRGYLDHCRLIARDDAGFVS